ncbi:MAG: type II toxin-antitoxin system VapC family toxin [Candidatus Daviesbacteria bacterium]|nr:type II toxin-antitoxin system VapC family toxin [Candidatus Daviesbacteria bacterium]
MEENNTFVVDSSFLLAYLLPDEAANIVQQFFDKLKSENIQLIAPSLLIFEIFNGLQTAVMRKRVNITLAKELGKRFLLMSIELVEIDSMKTLQLADKHKLTFYDASYLYLSKFQHAELLTLDKKLKRNYSS